MKEMEESGIGRPSTYAAILSTIQDKKYVEKVGDEGFKKAPVGAGPYKFAERVAQDRITIERVPDYWDAANYHFSRVTFRPITDSTVRLANLQAGSLDVNMAVTPVQLPGSLNDALSPSLPAAVTTTAPWAMTSLMAFCSDVEHDSE